MERALGEGCVLQMVTALGRLFAAGQAVFRIHPTELLGVTWAGSLYAFLRGDGSWVELGRLHRTSVSQPAGPQALPGFC